jgi:disulfide bond formation protein DsbB
LTERIDPTLSREDFALTGAFLLALAATLGALFIGEVLGQMPCTLCWYQRIAMFPLVPVLGVSLWRGDGAARAYGLPLALAAPIVPCTKDGPSCTGEAQMILGLPIPYLSLVAFAAISACLAVTKGPKT